MRAELHMRGISPGRLGSFRDKTLRDMLVKEKVREVHKLVATMASSFNNQETSVEKFDAYLNASLYQDVKDTRDSDMQEYYNNHVKNLSPEIYRDDNGEAKVRGLQ